MFCFFMFISLIKLQFTYFYIELLVPELPVSVVLFLSLILESLKPLLVQIFFQFHSFSSDICYAYVTSF